MNKVLIYGFFTALLASVAVGIYLKYFYAMEFDESYKVLPIWKVISAYWAISLPSAFAVHWIFTKYQLRGVIVLNALVVLLSIASIAYPITYVNQELDTTFISIAAIPAHFILPLFWLGLQPVLLMGKS
ncbi:MAG: hypothetical protein FJZ80_09880 [Bacteroidetes bacterium]|nr:hypothetical protein [Bacteroidota bacterium]MBM3425184.1 hypothetical protein [Bacteroidota bacterium]